uniref:Uncharacterized protein n=1 Tax=Globodera pallida TaxID=36090 RepID=A0A183CME0_GLOPA
MSSTPEGQQQQQLPRVSDDQQHYVSDGSGRVDTVRPAVRMNGTQNASSGMARPDFAQQLSNGPNYYHHHPVIHEDVVQHHHEHDDHDHHEVNSVPSFVECQQKLSSASSTAAFMQTPSVIAASLDSGSCSPIRSHSSPTPSSPSSTTTTDPRRTITTTMSGRLLSHQGSSQALLFVPEQRRVSTISGHSVRSCPTDICHSGLKDVEDGAESPVVGAAELDRHEEEEADEFHQLLIHSPSDNSVTAVAAAAAAEHVGAGVSRSVSPRAQAASDAYCRLYGNGTGAETAGEQQQHHQHPLPLNHQHQNRLSAVIHGRNRKTSPPGNTASGSRISPDFGRRRSLHTGAPAIAFRSTLSFAAAVAGANAGRIGGVALGGGTTARNSACQQQRRPLFQRRSSQPIIYSGAAGPAFQCRRHAL